MSPIEICYRALARTIMQQPASSDLCLNIMCGVPRPIDAITEKDIQEIQDLREQGITWEEISRMYGVGRTTIWARVYRYQQREGRA